MVSISLFHLSLLQPTYMLPIYANASQIKSKKKNNWLKLDCFHV